MKEQWFEIVRRTYDRYSWLLVETRGGRRRVLARAERDYRSKRRVQRAILRLVEDLPGARIIDATGSGGHDPYDLPDSSFDYVSGVIPLVVRDSPFDYAPAVVRRRRRRQDEATDHGDDHDDDHDDVGMRDRDAGSQQRRGPTSRAGTAPAKKAPAKNAPAKKTPAKRAPAKKTAAV